MMYQYSKAKIVQKNQPKCCRLVLRFSYPFVNYLPKRIMHLWSISNSSIKISLWVMGRLHFSAVLTKIEKRVTTNRSIGATQMRFHRYDRSSNHQDQVQEAAPMRNKQWHSLKQQVRKKDESVRLTVLVWEKASQRLWFPRKTDWWQTQWIRGILRV